MKTLKLTVMMRSYFQHRVKSHRLDYSGPGINVVYYSGNVSMVVNVSRVGL